MRAASPRVCHPNSELVSRVYRRDETRARKSKLKERVKFQEPVSNARANPHLTIETFRVGIVINARFKRISCVH